MNSQQFRECAKTAVDFIADYMDNIRERSVLPTIEPGYLEPLIPSEPPQSGEPWQDILGDVERVIMPGVTHWQSPNFFAYFPLSFSFPAVVADLVNAGLGTVGFNWISSPVITELEEVMMDWLAKLIGLPEMFLNSAEGPGTGLIQGTASEACFACLLSAKEKTIKEIKSQKPHLLLDEIRTKLVVYTSDQSHSSIEKAGKMGSLITRLLPSDKYGRLVAEVLENAILDDLKNGLYPCFASATFGSTETCAFDSLEELGPICNKYNVWLHVDAAYAGSAFSCPEYRYLMKGIEYADSFNFNPHKWMLINFDCSALWVKNANYLESALTVERMYLEHDQQETAPEHLHRQMFLGRRLRSLKIWFVLRSYGVEGIQNHIRSQISLSKYFKSLISKDDRFEVITCTMGLTCFRLKGDCSLSRKLLDKVMARKNIFIIICSFKGKLLLRFCVSSPLSDKSDIDAAWNEISTQADDIIPQDNNNNSIMMKSAYSNILEIE